MQRLTTRVFGRLASTPSVSVLARRRLVELPQCEQTLQASLNEAQSSPAEFWARQATLLKWRGEYDAVEAHDIDSGRIAWFTGGRLNVAENCIDRHVQAGRGQDVALIWEADEPGEGYKVTFQELQNNVDRLANVLKSRGVKKGDNVCIYMPMTPYAVYSMLACARIGAPHSVVFAGFSADALRSRIINGNCRVVLTADEGVRGGKIIPLRDTVHKALERCPDQVHSVIVHQRTGNASKLRSGDVPMEDAMQSQRPYCVSESMESEDPLFLLYTSGSTGAPKGLLHSTAGYLLHTHTTHKYFFDYQPGDVHACVADVGWVAGHSYVVYGPLSNGASTLLFESLPNYPDPGRYWDLVERHKVTQFYTAPTALRLLMKHDESFISKYDRSSLRILGSVGEPINPEAWRWYFEKVGEGRCPIADTWWQTETGGIMLAPGPWDKAAKPGAAMRPFPGVEPILLDSEGKLVEGNNKDGILVIGRPTPGMARTIYGDHQRYVDTYWKPFPGYFFTGDGAHRDEDGHIWITGRVDDVINVSGHRMGTAEVESALLEHSDVAEAAVVGYPHDLKGEGIYAYVVMKESAAETDSIRKELRDVVRRVIGPIATPDFIQIAPDLPKTRSGKIMRRILRKVAANQLGDLGDTSTLTDPSVVDVIIQQHEELVNSKKA